MNAALTLTSCEWPGDGGFSIVGNLRWRDRADRLELGCLWRTGDDWRDRCSSLGSQGLGAQAEDGRVRNSCTRKCWRSRCGKLELLARDCGPQTELELRLCGAEECLVDSRRV
jgi:hypothetical protein